MLQEFCGVGYYELDDQEANCFDFKKVSLNKLLEKMSYANSFISEVLETAKEKGI